MSDLEILMRYTGWSRKIAAAAIEQWRQVDPSWNAQYISRFLEPELYSDLHAMPVSVLRWKIENREAM